MKILFHTGRSWQTAICILICIFALQPCNASSITIKEKAGKGSFPLVATGKAAQLVIDTDDEDVVSIVANAFCEDIKLVTDVKPEVINQIHKGGYPVIIGTLGKCSFINQLESTGKIQTAEVKGKWETFSISVVDKPFEGIDQALVIFGSDARGTAFGVFELSRMIGVSPFVWWADVTPKKRKNLYVTQGERIFGPPSIQYRGLFINDEDWGLQPWAAKNIDTDVKDIGPRTYEKVFELMLRLKSNYLWPAMHPCTKAFWYYKESPELARKYDIVLGSSHCEQMLRNNVDEWSNNFHLEYPDEKRGQWNWATNSKQITRYWEDRVKESVNNEATYTLGMRGIHDSGMPGYKNNEDKRNALKEVIGVQRDMLQRNFGKPASEIPQIFCPYKEALTLYRMDIDLPEDVTMLWADDNFGYIRQLSNPEEQKRTGGAGVYYHFSYWGVPRDFLWLGSTPPALTTFELMKAYEMNCKKIWLFNIGDIKPHEYEMQFAMDFSWDVNSVNMADPNEYARRWSDETFGEGFADEIYEIKKEYYRIASSGKPEHIPNTEYPVSEMERRLDSYDKLVKRTQALESKIPVELKNAFFQLITYQIEAPAAMDMKVLGSRLSFEYANQGRKEEAIKMATESQNAYQRIVELTRIYNKDIANGKWDGIMDYAPRGLKKFYEIPVITTDSISRITPKPQPKEIRNIIPAGEYKTANGNGHNFMTINGLGIEACALTVWPLNMNTYEESNITSAPFAEYAIPVKKGTNQIDVRCLPTFPIYQGYKLRFAVSVGDEKPVFHNIQTEAESRPWYPNILRGYANGITHYESSKDQIIKVRIYFPDPGLVVSALNIISNS